ncbi:tudor domain-containing 6-like isoform X2 [Anticarsia gemmatalis]|uniref:tudor domain-containing 6-like isoform X2 n=1 Tax=Anticarsia gemmatalis TaxID=129554 RepID=UPI003F75A4A8
MSFVDLATLTMHRRNELEARLNIFNEKCDRAVDDIKKLKTKTQGFVLQLNCEPSELKERFLSCMKQLDEYMYLITDFNLAISKIDETGQIEYTPVHDTAKPLLPSTPPGPFNLIDALSEPAPSTSSACQNHCPPEKPKRVKVSKQDQSLIVFSSTSSSEETVQQVKNEVSVEVQCELSEELSNVKIEEPPSPLLADNSNLPAQTMLEADQVYEATIMHVDGAFFWVITDDPEEAQMLMIEMTKFYSENHKPITLAEVKALTCCAFYDDDSDCYYRGLFLKLAEGDNKTAEIFSVDTGEMRSAPVSCVQPLYSRFCDKPPYARCCHLAGVDQTSYHNKDLMEKQEEFMRGYIGTQCTIEVDDNTSESLGVYVVLSSGEVLNNMIVKQRLARPIDKAESPQPQHSREQSMHLPPPSDSESENTMGPEYDDALEAVTGYRNRDEAEICKHYKGGPEKYCFKGKKCTKRHVTMHPDGWTLDRVEVVAKCKSVALPAPDTWHKVLVTCVCHYDRVYVHLLGGQEKEEALPRFGVVLPPNTLSSLVKDMNSPAARAAYRPLTMTPALGELVAALYPLDGNWYRARVLSVTRADQSVEVIYVDYGTIMWVKEDQLRALDVRYLALPAQALRCVLAGVRARSHRSEQWAQAKRALSDMVLDKELDAHVVGREYDEVTVELYDDDGYSIAEQLAALNMVELVDYSVVDDSAITHKLVVP